ncbi:MAG: hypothetical protein WBB19_18580, partial [Desulforhopalus sp.]
DQQLGQFRSKELAHLVAMYRPRLVLVDHTPQGKHKELVQAVSAEGSSDTLWILGVRGVVGAVQQSGSEFAVNLFKNHYHAVLWYGDSSVLGTSHCDQLLQQYNSVPVECGYVLRLAESALWHDRLPGPDEPVAGTVAVPWLGENSIIFLTTLAAVLKKIPQSYGHWRLFVDTKSASGAGKIIKGIFDKVPNCRLEPPGNNYVSALLHSRIAIIYGGYNSLMDVVYAKIPALVVLREMQDEEQQVHLLKLQEVAGDSISTVSETEVSAEELEGLLRAHLQRNNRPTSVSLNINGAACAAEYIRSLLA